jgi:hypothetical protein
MPPMSRAALIVILVAVLAGAGLGLYFGWVAYPVQYIDTEPSSLQAAYKDDYVLMIATAYAGDGDLAAARSQLSGLGFADTAAAVAAAARRLAAAGLPATEQEHLTNLGDALAAKSGATPSATSP